LNGGDQETHKPEYETVTSLGTLLMNTDLQSIFTANEILNRAGMDSISAGGTLAFAIECFENGLLSLKDTGGIELKWGNSQAILQVIELMIRREGIGDELADGSLAAARRIGKGAERFAIQAGGQELAMHDGRNDPGFALHAAVEPTPGRHTIGAYLYYEMFQLWHKVKEAPAPPPLFYPKRKKYNFNGKQAEWAAMCSQYTALLNGAGGCLFAAFLGAQRFPVFDWLNAATGWSKTPAEYLRIGWNIQSVRQAFNARHAAPLKHPISERAVGQPPLARGANRGRTVPLDELTVRYWRAMGWDEHSGLPAASALQQLHLENIPEEVSNG
jgi:aldehyde:ferredoxin oxidoreductase